MFNFFFAGCCGFRRDKSGLSFHADNEGADLRILIIAFVFHLMTRWLAKSVTVSVKLVSVAEREAVGNFVDRFSRDEAQAYSLNDREPSTDFG